MKKLVFFLLFLIFNLGHSQVPKSGTYFYFIRYAESPSLKNSKADCKIIIDGRKIKVFYLGGTLSNIKKGAIIDEGILVKHKSGKWIIAKKESDVDIDEIGG
jgi:hypothetical protein